MLTGLMEILERMVSAAVQVRREIRDVRVPVDGLAEFFVTVPVISLKAVPEESLPVE